MTHRGLEVRRETSSGRGEWGWVRYAAKALGRIEARSRPREERPYLRRYASLDDYADDVVRLYERNVETISWLARQRGIVPRRGEGRLLTLETPGPAGVPGPERRARFASRGLSGLLPRD